MMEVNFASKLATTKQEDGKMWVVYVFQMVERFGWFEFNIKRFQYCDFQYFPRANCYLSAAEEFLQGK